MAETLGQFPLTGSVPSLADATLNKLYSTWVTNVDGVVINEAWEGNEFLGYYPMGDNISGMPKGDLDATSLTWEAGTEWSGSEPLSAIRVMQGYRLGPDEESNPNQNKPLASEEEAEALRTAVAGKQDALTFDPMPKNESANPVTSDGVHSALTSSTVVNRDMRNLKLAGLPTSGTGYFVFRTSDNFDYSKAGWDSSRSIWMIAIVGDFSFLGLRTTSDPKVYEAITIDMLGRVTHVANLDFDISDTLSFAYGGKAYTVFGVTDDTLSDIWRYALTTKAIDNGAVTLDDHAINAVAVSSALASLAVNFPAETSGKARDFRLRLTVASGVTTAPQLVLPQGVTCESADGTVPEIGADGKTTILYFTETAADVFLVKGEVVQPIL